MQLRKGPKFSGIPFPIDPQYNSEMDQMTRLEFTVQPDHLLRLVYAVKGVEDDRLNIAEPGSPLFQDRDSPWWSGA